MDYATPFINLLQWAADKGLINAAQAVGFAFFIWVYVSTSKTHKDSIQHINDANDRTLNAQKSQIDEQKDHISKCEERYSILRTDVTEMQKQVNQMALQAMFGRSDESHPQA